MLAPQMKTKCSTSRSIELGIILTTYAAAAIISASNWKVSCYVRVLVVQVEISIAGALKSEFANTSSEMVFSLLPSYTSFSGEDGPYISFTKSRIRRTRASDYHNGQILKM